MSGSSSAKTKISGYDWIHKLYVLNLLPRKVTVAFRDRRLNNFTGTGSNKILIFLCVWIFLCGWAMGTVLVPILDPSPYSTFYFDVNSITDSVQP
jgi:hypothetical protein